MSKFVQLKIINKFYILVLLVTFQFKTGYKHHRSVQNNMTSNWRSKLHEVIFEAETCSGKLFDIILILIILLSVSVVMLDSVKPVRAEWGELFFTLEWIFTIIFTIEYSLRLIAVGQPLKYATSFLGVIDLLSFLPTYFSLFLPGSQYFMVIRILRLLRIFRVLKLVQFLREARLLRQALIASRRKISVFLLAVLTLVVIFGSLMYVIEGEENGFTSIPVSIYWAVVTLTTVGYGDISPNTGLGQAIAAIVMILGYSIIAVPTGIVSVEIGRAYKEAVSTQACPQCSTEGHDPDAKFCKYCGSHL
jgi:voltage-gated potassium channel